MNGGQRTPSGSPSGPQGRLWAVAQGSKGQRGQEGHDSDPGVARKLLEEPPRASLVKAVKVGNEAGAPTGEQPGVWPSELDVPLP